MTLAFRDRVVQHGQQGGATAPWAASASLSVDCAPPMSEVEWVGNALRAAAAAFFETVPDPQFLVMAGGAVLCVVLLALILPRSR